MHIRIAGIIPESFVDGEGIRFAIFMQGCLRNCVGCHNPDTHALNGGYIMETCDIINQIKKSRLIKGITLTGGEPFLQIDAANELACAAKEMKLDVWCYTGYTLEELLTISSAQKLLRNIDVLVDGAYIESLRDIELLFRGSSNQRIIHMKTSNFGREKK